MTSKISDHDDDNDDDDNQTEKDLYKTVDHTTKTNNTAFEPVQKTANVFSRLMHSEEHAQNNKNNNRPYLKRLLMLLFNEFISFSSIAAAIERFLICFVFQSFRLEKYISLSLSLDFNESESPMNQSRMK